MPTRSGFSTRRRSYGAALLWNSKGHDIGHRWNTARFDRDQMRLTDGRATFCYRELICPPESRNRKEMTCRAR